MRKKINKNKFNFLIVRLSSMGDVILASMIPRLIKNKFPDSKIDFAVSGQFSETVEFNPFINSVFKYDKSADAFENKKLLKNHMIENKMQRYDYIIDLQKNLRSLILASNNSNHILKYEKRRLHKLSLVYLKKPLEIPARTVPEMYISTLSPLEINDDGLGTELWLPEESEKIGNYHIHISQRINKRNRIALAAGAFHFTKRWLPERFAKLAEILQMKYGAEIILLGGEKDKTISNEIAGLSKAEVSDCSGSTSIIETARLLDTCSLLVSNDTGVMHIAAARKVPVAAIFGSTVPAFGFAPFRTKSVIIESDIPCRPCTHIGKSVCPKGHFDCMKSISAEAAATAAASLL